MFFLIDKGADDQRARSMPVQSALMAKVVPTVFTFFNAAPGRHLNGPVVSGPSMNL
jgi:hypothetical protein